MKDAFSIIAAVMIGLAGVALFGFVLFLVLGRALANEPFEVGFVLVPIVGAGIAVGLLALALRVGSGRRQQRHGN